MKTRKTLIHKVPSATFHFTFGDDTVYMDFVDRKATIKYRLGTPKANYLLNLMHRKGSIKFTNPRV